jgi:hypothetical protein
MGNYCGIMGSGADPIGIFLDNVRFLLTILAGVCIAVPCIVVVFGPAAGGFADT